MALTHLQRSLTVLLIVIYRMVQAALLCLLSSSPFCFPPAPLTMRPIGSSPPATSTGELPALLLLLTLPLLPPDDDHPIEALLLLRETEVFRFAVVASYTDACTPSTNETLGAAGTFQSARTAGSSPV